MSLPTQSPSQIGTSDNSTQHVPPPRVRRRNRQITSCLECRRRKLKCDKGSPCVNCTRNSRPCVFITSGLDANAQKKVAEVKEKMGMLERSLEDDITKTGQYRHGCDHETMKPNPLPGQQENHDDQEDDDEKELDTTYYVTEDAAYYDNDAQADDDIIDLGIAIGKMRITDRIGGLVRPRFSEELKVSLTKIPKTESADPNTASVQEMQGYLAPGQSYIAPSSSFFFAPGVEKTSLRTFLPTKPLVDNLIMHYWQAVHVIARTVHRPSFEKQYEIFWARINAGAEPRASFQAVVFAALLSSIISMSEHQVLAQFGVDKQSLVDNFKQGTEAALARANFLRSTKLETIQAFVMYLIPLCRSEISRAHSALTGTVIRLAECMGLHRDPANYSSSPVEIHVRRLIWHQICFLDLRTCEASGPRPQIRHDDYDTRFPLNIDDVDLERAENGEAAVDTLADKSHFTDMTITRMRFECYEMHRVLWRERPKLEQRKPNGERKVTLVSLLSRVQSFQAAMEKTYLPMLNKSIPLHVLANEIYGIISDRLFILLLQKYTPADRSKKSRLRQLTISSAVRIIERSMVIEQQPAMSAWSWYVGALHQYHVALLLLSELYSGHNEPGVEARVWKCMDFAFELSTEMSNREKARTILEDLVKKTGIYQSMKGLRAPINMPHPAPYEQDTDSEPKNRQESEHTESLQSDRSDSGVSNFVTGSHHVPQQISLPQQVPDHRLRQMQPHKILSFPGAVPNVDWGSIDLPGSASNPQPSLRAGTSDLGNNPHSRPALSTYTSDSGNQYNQGRSPDPMAYGETLDRALSAGLFDPINEIDWNDIENMFGDSELDSGMLVPRFTFPQFSPGDLNWPSDGRL